MFSKGPSNELLANENIKIPDISLLIHSYLQTGPLILICYYGIAIFTGTEYVKSLTAIKAINCEGFFPAAASTISI